MDIICTRPSCPRPKNSFSDLDDRATLKTVQQKYCTSCGMPLILAGRYLPSRLLGKGGFGAAYLACDRHTPTMRRCVVKLFQPAGNLNQQQLELAQDLFEREATVLEDLGNRHVQIPDLYAFFPLIVQKDQFFYLVQEYIDGKTLEDELAEQGQFSEAEVRHILVEMLKVLKFVHENNSIHRDIKPSNIMRDRNGRLFLLDFGAVKQETVGSAQTGKSTGIYSMGFAPPEQMAGSQVYPSTDLYALAVTCLILLTGKQPEDLYDSFHNRLNWQAHLSGISDRTTAILDKMLQTTPRDRFQSAQEVLDEIESSPTSPVSPSPPLPLSPSPPTPPTPPTPSSPVQRSKHRPFSLLEVLGSAAFTGFEGSLLYIAFASFIPSPGIGIGIWGMCMGGLLFALYRRAIEGKDLPILAGLTLLLMLIPVLRGDLAIAIVAAIAVLGGAAAIAVTALFRLIYQILSRFL